MIHIRANPRMGWRCAGRWETPEKALEVAKSVIEESFDYMIEEIIDGTVIQKGRVIK